MKTVPINILCPLMALASLIASVPGKSDAFNRYAHVELFKKSVAHLDASGLTEAYEFYRGKNSDSVDIVVLADEQDEIMWVDIHSTTEPDQNAAEHLIDNSYPYCWNDSLESLKDPTDVEACKDCVRAVVDQFPAIALPRAGQETVFFPSRGAARSRYDFRWELPLSLLVGLVDPDCDTLATRYGVLAQNSLRAEVKMHSARFKSLEYLNYAIRAWNDNDCESSLRWLTRIVNYDPHHSMTAFKSYDYLTEDWVSVDMDGDMDIDYDDAEAWNRELVNFGAYYQFLFCEAADTRLQYVEPGSVAVHSGEIFEHHSSMMTERASYSATAWSQVDELIDYFNGNANGALDDLLPRAATSTAGLLADFFHNVVEGDHPEFVLVCVEGVPRNREFLLPYELDFGDRAIAGAYRLRGEHFRFFKIPVSVRIEPQSCLMCDTVMGYRLDRIRVTDGHSSYETFEQTFTADRAATIHLIYTPYWPETDRADQTGTSTRAGQFASTRSETPPTLFLSRISPNPAGGTAKIAYSLPASTFVDLRLFRLNGELVTTLVRGANSTGLHTVSLDTSELAAGVYICRLEAAGQVRATKVVVLK